MKKGLILIIAVAMVVLPMFSCSRYGPPPEMEEVYDRLVEVIEESHEVNVLLFGAGLPTYARGDAEDDLIHRYYNFSDSTREYVTPYAKFATITDMREAIARVYGSEYRESLMESLFTGYADTGVSVSLPARYSEDEKAMYQNKNITPLVTGTRVYDYAGMRMLKGSNQRYIKVEIRSYTEDCPEEWVKVTLSFVYENGNWYLNSPSC